MGEKALNTIVEFEMADGTKVNMTLTFFAVYQLAAKDKKLYDDYNKIAVNGPQTEIDMVTVLYTAYKCANLDNIENTIGKLDFIKNMPVDRKYASDTYRSLTSSKKK